MKKGREKHRPISLIGVTQESNIKALGWLITHTTSETKLHSLLFPFHQNNLLFSSVIISCKSSLLWFEKPHAGGSNRAFFIGFHLGGELQCLQWFQLRICQAWSLKVHKLTASSFKKTKIQPKHIIRSEAFGGHRRGCELDPQAMVRNLPSVCCPVLRSSKAKLQEHRAGEIILQYWAGIRDLYL